MLKEDDLRDVLDLLQELAPDQLSMVYASLNDPNSQIGTARDGANGAFLAKLAELQLAKEIPLDVDVRANVTSFAINEDAKAYVKALIDVLVKARSQAQSGL